MYILRKNYNVKSKPANIAAPEVQILSQYIKDLSFENPKGSAAFRDNANLSDTKIDLNARVENIIKISETEHEVTLEIKGKGIIKKIWTFL